MTTVQMLAVLFMFTMVGGLAFMLVGKLGIWRAVPGAAKPGSTKYDDNAR